MQLFVYGTLMDDALVDRLTGRRFPKERARLAGYRKMTPPGGYPYIVPDATAAVEGFVLLDVDTDALRILDAYEDEGRLYRRSTVVITLDGRSVEAMAYVGV
jgi:gamma-glutamylcyclotransferase (GGCT)/AIG2-like uncharacterized protein YtfP